MHILGLSETKLKEHKLTSMFQVEGYQSSFRKDNYSNGSGGRGGGRREGARVMVYVRNDINAKRREDLEINNISCIWWEIPKIKVNRF